jgi:hypothetical protein
LQIPDNVARCLGFTQSIFPTGEHTSVNSQSLTLYSEIPKDKMLVFNLYTWMKQFAKIAEPEDHSIDSLIVYLSEAITPLGHKISWEEEGNLLSVRIGEKGA